MTQSRFLNWFTQISGRFKAGLFKKDQCLGSDVQLCNYLALCIGTITFRALLSKIVTMPRA